MKKLAVLTFLIIGPICYSFGQPASGVIYYTDGSSQSFQNIKFFAGNYYDHKTTFVFNVNNNAVIGKVQLFYNNSYREVPFRDIRSFEVINYSIYGSLVKDATINVITKNGVNFQIQLAVFSQVEIEVKDELSMVLTTIKVNSTKLVSNSKYALNIKSIIFD